MKSVRAARAAFTPISSAFTLIELLTVIGILAVLAAILVPVFAGAREGGRTKSCLSNMKQLGVGLMMYLQDYDDMYPMNRFADETHPLRACAGGTNNPGLDGSRYNWKRQLLPYVRNREMYLCPTNPYAWRRFGVEGTGDESNRLWPDPADHLPVSYALNGTFFHESQACKLGEARQRARRADEISATANLIVIVETRLNFPDLGTWTFAWPLPTDDGGMDREKGVFHFHQGMSNFVFADGHAARHKLTQTCERKMWSDRFPDPDDGCRDLAGGPPENRQ